MTDAEMVQACAVNIMGWDRVKGYWNPLKHDSDAFMLVDRIAELYCDFSLERSGTNWTADFSSIGYASNTSRCRAIVLAAIGVADATA